MIRKSTLSLITFFTMSCLASAQQTSEWGITAGGTKEDEVTSILHSENHLYMTGKFADNFSQNNTTIEGKGNTDIYLSKVNKKGNTEWIKSLGGNGADRATCITQGDECILMAGEISGTVSQNKKTFSGEGKALFVSSWHSSGKINWLTRVVYTGNATIDILETAPDGTILAGGMISGTITIGKDTLSSKSGRRAYTFTLSSQGKLACGILTSGKGYNRLVAAKFGFEGARYLLFNTYGWMIHGEDITHFKQNESFKGLVLVKQTNDKTNWVKYIEGTGYIQGVQLAVTGKDHVSACINYSKTLTIADTTLNTSALQDIAVINYSADGKLNWIKQIKSSVVCYAMDARETRNGKLLITGYFRDSYSFGENNILADNKDATENMFLVQLDENGELSWYDQPGSQAAAFGKSIAIGSNGNIFMAGGFKNAVTFDGKELKSRGKEDILVAKYFNCEQLEARINEPDPLCEGNVLELSVQGSSFETFLWNDETWSKTYPVTGPGTFSVEAFDNKGCSAIDTITVEWAHVPELGLPEETILSPGNEILLTANSGFASYLWNDGTTGEKLLVAYNPDVDSAMVVVTAQTFEGCSTGDSTVIRFFMDKNPLALYSASQLKSFPNPVRDKLSWYCKTTEPTDLIVTLTDEAGLLIFQQKIGYYIPHSINTINMEGLAGGNYMLAIKTGDSVLKQKVIKK